MISHDQNHPTFDELLANAPDAMPPAANRPIETLVSIPATGEKTMSSLLIAEITGKPHRNVTGDIERILKEVEIDAQGFLHIYIDSQNRQQKCYMLPRRECDLIVSGYSSKYRLAIIDRWTELEAKQAAPVALPGYAESLRQLADSLDRNAALEEKIEEQQKDVDAIKRIADSDGSLCITDAAKTLQMPPRKLSEWLQIHGWIHRRPGCSEWIGYQDKINQGLVITKIVTFHNSLGEDASKPQCRITPRGVTKLATQLKKS